MGRPSRAASRRLPPVLAAAAALAAACWRPPLALCGAGPSPRRGRGAGAASSPQARSATPGSGPGAEDVEALRRELEAERARSSGLLEERERLRAELAELAERRQAPPWAGDAGAEVRFSDAASPNEMLEEGALRDGLDGPWRPRVLDRQDSGDTRVFRQNSFTGRWTLYVRSGGAQKPRQYKADPNKVRAGDQPEHEPRCPFCPGNEERCPDPLLQIGPDGELREGPELDESWRVRVIPNIFPILVTPPGAYGDAYRTALEGLPHSAAAEGKQRRPQLLPDYTRQEVDAVGYSEVVIESRRHNALLGIVAAEEISLSLRAVQARGRVLASKPGTMMILYFKQYGPLSGGSLVHPHMQIMAVPIVTPEMQVQLTYACQYHDKFNRCMKCYALRDELLRDDLPRQRLLYESTHFLAVMPFAGRAFHVSIVPRAHSHTWLGIGREEIDDLADVLQVVMETLYHMLDDPSYIINIFSVDSPSMLEEFGESVKDAFHWGLEIQPRFPSDIGGVELASGIRVVEGIPTEKARQFR